MTHTAFTWGLTSDWDLDIDENGNPRELRSAEAICQDVANEARLFLHDAYFRYEEGIDWFTDQLGRPLQEAVLRDRLRTAALRVPGVLSVESIDIEEVDESTRKLHGKITITTEAGSGISVF